MKFFPLLWSSLWRKKIRTIFTLAVGVHRVRAVRTADDDPHGAFVRRRDRRPRSAGADPQGQPDHAAADRLPGAAAATEGVEMVSHQSWFGGVYQDPSNFFAQMVVEPEPFMKIYPEFKICAGARQGVARRSPGRHRRRRPDAKRFDWKVGDRIPIMGTIWQPKQGQVWEFNIAGIYDGEAGVDKTQFFFRYDYLNENRHGGRRAGRLVRREDQGSVAGAADGGEVRRHVRQLLRRDQDHHREGLRRGLRQTDRRHRRDHGRDPGRGAVHDAAGRGQHHGAVGARAHQRSRRAEDAGLLERRRSWRWCWASRC